MLSYTDTLGNRISVQLATTFEDVSNVDSIAIFDYLEVGYSNPQAVSVYLTNVTEYQKNVVSAGFLAQGYHSNQFIGDTTLYGIAFSDVYTNVSNTDLSLFYNKEKGVLALRISADKYWVLKD